MSESLATFVDVLLPLPLEKYYTYRVPTEMESTVQPGMRVVVPFGKNKRYVGLIRSISHQPPVGYEARFFHDLLDDTALISEPLFAFWEWMSQYYLCTVGEVMNAALPASLKPESKTSISLNPEFDLQTATSLNDREYLIVEALTTKPVLSIEEVASIVQLKHPFPVIRNMLAEGILHVHEQLEETYKPKYITCVRYTAAFATEDAQDNLLRTIEKNEAQVSIVMAMYVLQKAQARIEKRTLLEKSNTSDSPLRTLINRGVLELYEIQEDRIKMEEMPQVSFDLNDVQQVAIEQVKDRFKEHDTVLLHGITSSGKTHIYVKLIEEQVEMGRQVLMLLPEIALTSQIIFRIKKYFGDHAIAFHSGIPAHERTELWHKIRENKIKVIIGARSSVFLPFSDLGLIIVDEEHETSYKQSEPAPRYHARDAAIWLGISRSCKTLLGSATPSFESYYNAQQGKYGLVTLHSRFGDIALPRMMAANLAEEAHTKQLRGSFTSVLYDQIQLALQSGEQVILFQNRRGYAPILECNQCHHVPRCINCDISLTYHKFGDQLKCHYCGYAVPRMRTCVACGNTRLELKGLGTEKIEDELSVHFPEARIARLDLDSAKGRTKQHQIISSFESHQADILVGTQMLSKGLDFGNVTLVGVINADQLLHFPDFRAYERAYQLLSQVSGRAGRKKKRGTVVIQTSIPDHHVVQEVLHHQYEQMYANGIIDRKSFGYPPFTRLIKLVIKHREERLVSETASFLFQGLYPRLGAFMIGPETPHVSRIRNYYIREILIKIERESGYLNAIKQHIKAVMHHTLVQDAFKSARIFADVDPLS